MRLTTLVVILLACAEAPPPAPACLATDRQAVTAVCPGRVLTTGVDVSEWSGEVDWARVREAGHAFALVRVSDGLGRRDARFARHWRGAREAGLLRGAYQYLRPGSSPWSQAALLLDAVAEAGGPGELPPALDVETSDGLPAAEVRLAARAWLAAVEAATGRPPLLYTAPFMEPTLGEGFARFPLWVAHHGAACPLVPAGWRGWTLWQTAPGVAVPGVAGPADLDVFDGSLEALTAWALGSPDAGPVLVEDGGLLIGGNSPPGPSGPTGHGPCGPSGRDIE